jgi:hypothetical protein
VVTEVFASPVKKQRGRSRANAELQADANPTEFTQVSFSQVHNPTQLSGMQMQSKCKQVLNVKTEMIVQKI